VDDGNTCEGNTSAGETTNCHKKIWCNKKFGCHRQDPEFHGKSLKYRYKMANVRALEPSFKTQGLLDILEAA